MPIAADGEAILIFVHVGIGAVGQVEVLANHPGGGGQYLVGAFEPRRRCAELVEEAVE
jgi:hypothetical protein